MSLSAMLDDLSLPGEPDPQVCIACHARRDAHGFCECDPPAVVCMLCETVIREGRGLPQWEAGGDDDELIISHGCCDACFAILMEKIR